MPNRKRGRPKAKNDIMRLKFLVLNIEKIQDDARKRGATASLLNACRIYNERPAKDYPFTHFENPRSLVRVYHNAKKQIARQIEFQQEVFRALRAEGDQEEDQEPDLASAGFE